MCVKQSELSVRAWELPALPFMNSGTPKRFKVANDPNATHSPDELYDTSKKVIPPEDGDSTTLSFNQIEFDSVIFRCEHIYRSNFRDEIAMRHAPFGS